MKTYECEVTLNFQLGSFAQLTSLRNVISNYITNRDDGSSYDIKYVENNNSSAHYRVRVLLHIMVTGRADVNTVFTQIDNALPSLPPLISIGGNKTRYAFFECEV